MGGLECFAAGRTGNAGFETRGSLRFKGRAQLALVLAFPLIFSISIGLSPLFSFLSLPR